MINYLLFFLLFIISFLIVKRINVLIKSDRYNKKNNFKSKIRNYQFKDFISNINFIKKKEKFLYKQGNPFKLNSTTYYFFKILISIVLFISSVKTYNFNIIPIIFLIIGYFLIDIFIFINKKTRDAEICNDLLSVTDSICVQLSAHVPLKDLFKKQYENCKNKDFKKAIITFSTKYELSELNIENALTELKDKFDILEIDMFCYSLGEYNKTGNIIEILENFSELLREKQIDKLKTTTTTKIIYITFGVMIALVNIILITFYPLFISIGQGFNNIFR